MATKNTKAMKELEEYNTLKRETKGFQQKKPGTPYSELPMKEKLRRLMKKTPKANIGGAAAGAAAGVNKLKKPTAGGAAAGAAAGVNKLKKPRAGVGKIREYKLTEIATGGSVKKMSCGGAAHKKPKKMAIGGVAKAKKGRRGDGICRTGKTRGRMV